MITKIIPPAECWETKETHLFTLCNLALLLCAAAVVGLFLPVYSARDQLEGAFLVTVKMVNLPEFSGWGGVIILPFLLAVLLLCDLTAAAKTMCWFGLNLASAFALPAALLAARQYLLTNVGHLITRQTGLAMFLPMLIAASVMTLCAIIKETSSCPKSELHNPSIL